MEDSDRPKGDDSRGTPIPQESSGPVASAGGAEITDITGEPGKKRTSSKPWYKHPSTLIALGALIIALVSAGTSIIQVNTAKQQNIADEQQELVTLVTDIANDPATVAEQSLTLQNNPTAVSQAANGAEYAELADSEEAANLISLLNGNGVTATDYYETALGLQPSDSYAQALKFLNTAVGLPSDPRTHASILRYEAEIYYNLGAVSKAERSDALAEQAFNNAPDVTKANQENNVADTEFFDAWYQAAISCSTALAEMSAAEEIFTSNLSAMYEGTTSAYSSTTEELQHEGCLETKSMQSAETVTPQPSIIAASWQGSYVCGQGVTGLNIIVTGASDYTITAIFDFYPLPGNANVPSGSFTMTGKYSATGVFLTPVQWLVQPRGYGMVGLSGQLTSGGQVLSGTVTGLDCTTFFVHRS
jgi:tetratricopeptide (TPR) repeat protein